MKAIIIDDKDGDALLDSLELTKLQKGYWNGQEPTTLEQMHRTFHYVVVRWLQDQGYRTQR